MSKAKRYEVGRSPHKANKWTNKRTNRTRRSACRNRQYDDDRTSWSENKSRKLSQQSMRSNALVGETWGDVERSRLTETKFSHGGSANKMIKFERMNVIDLFLVQFFYYLQWFPLDLTTMAVNIHGDNLKTAKSPYTNYWHLSNFCIAAVKI